MYGSGLHIFVFSLTHFWQTDTFQYASNWSGWFALFGSAQFKAELLLQLLHTSEKLSALASAARCTEILQVLLLLRGGIHSADWSFRFRLGFCKRCSQSGSRWLDSIPAGGAGTNLNDNGRSLGIIRQKGKQRNFLKRNMRKTSFLK